MSWHLYLRSQCFSFAVCLHIRFSKIDLRSNGWVYKLGNQNKDVLSIQHCLGHQSFFPSLFARELGASSVAMTSSSKTCKAPLSDKGWIVWLDFLLGIYSDVFYQGMAGNNRKW